MKRYLQNNCSLLRLFAGWCGLLLYVGAFSPIGLGVTALLGTIDADHHALFQPGTNGTRLVLHHEGNCSSHQHHAIARALSLFAQPASNTDPDHVVQFAGGDGFWRDFQLVVIGANSSEQPVMHSDVPVLFHSLQLVRALPSSRPQPDIVGNLFNVRFTVFLI